MKFTSKSTIVILVLLSMTFAGQIFAGKIIAGKVSLFVGDVKVLNNVSAKRIAIGKKSVLKVRVLSGKQILIIAQEVGATDMYIWLKNGDEMRYNIQVKDPEVRAGLEDTILMKVKIVEFLTSKLRELGIKWNSTIDGPTAAGAVDLQSNNLFRGSSSNSIFNSLPLRVNPLQTYFGIATEIKSKINLMVQAGDAFTIAEPTLSTKNGGKAKFLAGGEIPVSTTSAFGQAQIEYKEYGIKLNIAPVADEYGNISANLMTEVSRLDFSTSVNGQPGFLTRRTETEVSVKDGQTIVISGLINQEQSRDADKVPFLGNIPIIGYLFKSERFQSKKAELVIFVTPSVRKSAAKTDFGEYSGIIERVEARKEAIAGHLKGVIVD